VQIILHRGAKKRADANVTIDDPGALLTWLGPDRATVIFADVHDIATRREAFAQLIREWIALL
jgi:hypothetical protein